MLELPEAFTVAHQIKNTIMGKRIANVISNHSPHKFAWYYGDPENYRDLLIGKTMDDSISYGGFVEIKAGSATILVGDGAGLKYHGSGQRRPEKHQLLIEFEDDTAISVSVQMYGGIWCFNRGEFSNPYIEFAKRRPSPLSEEFSQSYFNGLIFAPDVEKISVKAFLATNQRIPGLGNGVLQDILWNAKIHPKRNVNSLSCSEKEILFFSIKRILFEMAKLRGRDTEKDFFGMPGGYKTVMSKNNKAGICPKCGGPVKKESYMGGNIYYCIGCQVI